MSEQIAPNSTFSYYEPHEVEKGNTILLQCNFSTLGGLLKGSWSRGNEKLTEDLKVISSDPRLNVILQYDLEIENVQYTDEGEYTCYLARKEEIFQSFYYRLRVVDSPEAIKANYTLFAEDLNPVIAVVNETATIPCQGIYMRLGEDNVQWQLGKHTTTGYVEEYIFELKLDYQTPDHGTNRKVIGGYFLEIQNVNSFDTETEYVCNLQDPKTNTSYGSIVHKLIFSNETIDMCSQSLCGLNAECRFFRDYTECDCRPEFKGSPPNCIRDDQENMEAHKVCLSKSCKEICELLCGINAKCVTFEYEYKCLCLDNHYGNPKLKCKRADLETAIQEMNKTGSETYEIYLNDAIALPCRATFPYGLPKQIVYWKKRPADASFRYQIDFPQPRMQIYNQYHLMITKANVILSGYYLCQVKSDGQNISYHLNISDSFKQLPNLSEPVILPSHESFSTTIKYQGGDYVVLPCEGMNLGFHDMTWGGIANFPVKNIDFNEIIERAEENTQDFPVRILFGYDLEIQNVQADDAGTYFCFMPMPQDERLSFLVTSHVLKVLDPSNITNQDDPCEGHQCDENSECYVKNKNPVCTCRADNQKDSKLRCKKIVCMNEYCHSICNQTCESQMNATCKIQNYRWTCTCDDGFMRNPHGVCVPDDSDVDRIADSCGTECVLVSIFGSILFLLLTAVVMFLLKRNRKRLNRREKHLTNDEISALNPFNSSLIDHYKIYDKELEFPRQRLFLEDVIGEGHYGRVLRAQASGLPGRNGTSTVAVKTLKKNATSSHLADLISEYQILKEFDHPNIIRLLGICSKDGPLYIIMEYAENGSLSSYLRKTKKKITTQQTENLDGSDFITISPTEILNFAWQIAKGMSYLAQMKFVHRDLAARNVLVTKDLICKISDFGLSKDVYSCGIYTKTSKAEVPVKWLAIESLSEDEYTTKSDVWSFGIVLWELITYGNIPYPDLHNRDVLPFLKEGNRLKKPDDCSDGLYEIMLSCWKENPEDRPEFQDLVEKFDEMLSSSVYYLQCSGDDQDDNYVIAQ